MEVLYKKVGFYGAYYDETVTFFREYFESEDEMFSFFDRIFANDFCDKTPRKMMNQIVRWVGLANDIGKIRPGRDPLQILCVRNCMESLCGMAEQKIPDSKKSDEQKSFFGKYLSKEGIEYFSRSFRIINIVENGQEKEALSKDVISEFENMLFIVRNNAVHDGDYWSTQIFSRKKGTTWISAYVDIKNNRVINFETEIDYDVFMHFFVESSINFINNYLGIMTEKVITINEKKNETDI